MENDKIVLTEEQRKKPHLVNCLVIRDTKSKTDTLFSGEGEDISCYLDGYAIIPMAKYLKMKTRD